MGFIGTKNYNEKWEGLHNMMGHYPGSSISYNASGVWGVVNQKEQATYAKGVMTTSGSAGGVLQVHLIDDYNTSDTKIYCPLPLGANDLKPCVFDEIKESGTTISLDDIIVAL